uniref:CCHC-type domain-containing protein n=1 Tax=Tanacetum cinerariifolium TaxID=118510 RepID=A0A699H1H8_TANCI|nr:hypothetical protein [Tanacetum cinerariifolium]
MNCNLLGGKWHQRKEPQGHHQPQQQPPPHRSPISILALIDQGVGDALAAHNADRSMNGDDSHNSGMGVRRQAPLAHKPKKKMIDKYCPRGDIKKLEVEMWNMKVKGTDVPKTMQNAIEFATELIDKKISTLVEHQAENKRKLDNNNQAQQQPLKKQGVAIAYSIRPGEKKEYVGTLPLCYKCKFHHISQCTIKCANCKRVGHLTRDCRSPAATNNQRNSTCYECGNQGHYRSDFPELKNQNHRNQAGGIGAQGMMHALGRGETNQDLSDMDDDINA